MIQFDTIVCHPYRCVLVIMETLGFGIGIVGDGKKDGSSINTSWLLSPNESEMIISRAWKILNDVSLDPRGSVLQYPVLVLSSAAILVASEGGIVENCIAKDKDDESSGVKLPNFWWRALDVPSNDITKASNAIRKVIH